MRVIPCCLTLGGFMPYAYRSESLMARARVYDLTQHDSVELLSMGDLHATSAHADLAMIHEAIGWLKGADNRYAVMPGDVADTAIKGSVSLDLSEVGMSAKDGRHMLEHMLRPVADRILAVVPGNHDDRLSRDTGEDSVDALMCSLGIGDRYFAEGECFLQLRVGGYAHNHKPCIFNGLIVHGTAGGRLPGGKANSLLAMRQIVHNADFYLNGHGHTPMVLPDVAWSFDRFNVNEKKQMFISCGSSLKRAGYPVKKSYPPLARVWPTLILHGDGRKHMSAVIEH